MKGLNQIEREANTLITSALQEQNSVLIPAIGRFEPIFHPEYILMEEQSDGTTRKLIPPHISLSFIPSEYILQHSHYTKVDFTPPLEYFETSFTSNLSDLHEHNEMEVRSCLSQHLRNVLIDLFRGRRTTLLEIGDLYVTEEGDNNLLINFVASEEILKSLNFVFSAYQPVELNPSVSYPDTEIRTELHENKVIQISVHKEEKAIPVAYQPHKELIPESVETNPLKLEKDEKASNPDIKKEVKPIKEPSTKKTKEKKSNNGGFILLAICVILILAFLYIRTKNKDIESENTTPPKTEVTASEVPQISSNDKNEVTPLDTITVERGTTLAKLSRAYYDNNSYFWVYIYFANHEKIKDPNNLEIGDQLIIPSLDVYNLLDDPQKADREAKEWASLIQLNTFTSYEEQRATLPMNRHN